jgi:magnesium transporter
VPDRWELTEKDHEFAFALDERGVVIIDEDGYARKLVQKIVKTRRWRVPSLERFFSDFLETMIRGDSTFLEALEDEISRIEEDILEGRAQKDVLSRIADIRGDLLALRIHYEQMIDFGQELSSNDNAFFKEDKLHYFDNYVNRVTRLLDIVNSLRDYSVQTRDLYQSQLAVRQNNTVTVLTVVTTIFMPLTLIVGWYGMNFKYMPELESPLGYPLVIVVSIAIIVVSLIYFKYKKWL